MKKICCLDLLKKFYWIVKRFITIGNVVDSLVSHLKGHTECLSLNNYRWQVVPTLVNINSDKTLFYLFTVIINKCGGSCTTIDDLYGQVCVTNIVKSLNVKVLNLIS